MRCIFGRSEGGHVTFLLESDFCTDFVNTIIEFYDKVVPMEPYNLTKYLISYRGRKDVGNKEG